jgi:hypothetical protein
VVCLTQQRCLAAWVTAMFACFYSTPTELKITQAQQTLPRHQAAPAGSLLLLQASLDTTLNIPPTPSSPPS